MSDDHKNTGAEAHLRASQHKGGGGVNLSPDMILSRVDFETAMRAAGLLHKDMKDVMGGANADSGGAAGGSADAHVAQNVAPILTNNSSSQSMANLMGGDAASFHVRNRDGEDGGRGR